MSLREQKEITDKILVEGGWDGYDELMELAIKLAELVQENMMDPNANLKEQMKLIGEIQSCKYVNSARDELAEKGERLAELVEAMDEWLRKGGFLPKAWTGE